MNDVVYLSYLNSFGEPLNVYNYANMLSYESKE